MISVSLFARLSLYQKLNDVIDGLPALNRLIHNNNVITSIDLSSCKKKKKNGTNFIDSHTQSGHNGETLSFANEKYRKQNEEKVIRPPTM